MSKSVSNRVPSLCVFANFFIDNEERFQRMKDSFNSFRSIHPDEWIINVRGRFKQEVGYFLKESLHDRLQIHYLDSKNWFHDSQKIVKHSLSDIFLFWIEDHICLTDTAILNETINEMYRANIDHLYYSWFHDGLRKKFYSSHKPCISNDFFDAWKIDDVTSSMIRRSIGNDFYAVSCVSLMRRDFFLKVLFSPKPYLKRWPQNLPFDFEKKSTDRVVPSFLTALPKTELFAAIDDNHGQENYCLISRGLYPDRVARGDLKKIEYTSNSTIGLKKVSKLAYSLLPKSFCSFLSDIYILLTRVLYSLGLLIV
jgi:hypothetical protein